MASSRSTRRRFIGGLAAASIGVPTLLRAQPKTVKVGMVSPVTGPMADVGQDSRLGAQLAVEAVNAAGGIKSLGGARIELLTADSETKPDVARSEADRLINAGAQIMTGTFHSAHVATVALLAQQRRVPYVIDISAADAPTANAAKSVREGHQKTQYVYRIFPGSATFGRNAVRYMAEIFREAGVSPKRVVLMYSNDLFGKTQTDSFQAALRTATFGFEVVDVIPYPENALDLSTEVSRARAAKPDVLAPITRPATASCCSRSWRGSGPISWASSVRARPGSTRPSRSRSCGDKIEYMMDCTVYAGYRKPEVRKIAAAYEKRSGGRHFDASGAYSYEAILVIADVLERAASTEPDAVVAAIRKTSFADGVTVSTGPVVFNEIGDNPNASTAMLQILGQQPKVVWPKDAAEQKFVFPRPKA